MSVIKRFLKSNVGTALVNILLAYVVFMLTRVAFVLENWHTFGPYLDGSLVLRMLHGGLVFDTSALLYLNALYLVLTLLPVAAKELPRFHQGLKWLYVVTNGLGAAMNLCDAVYVQYTGRRTTVTVFSEFTNEGNIASIIGTELLRHWYLVLLFVLLVAGMWVCFRKPDFAKAYTSRRHYYWQQAVSLVLLAPLAIVGIRGSVFAGTKPITINNANQFVNRPIEGTVVLNTPFSIIRTIGKKVFADPKYFTDAEMRSIYDPIVQPAPADSLTLGHRNVVVLIMESMGKEYIGSFNRDLEGGRYKGYMPFVDSLAAQSLTFEYSYANGRISMDAMPSVLCGIPMMVEPFFLTPASLNDVGGLPKLLAPLGYYSAFMHGGHNISMGFNAFSHSAGFKDYFGLDEYCQSPKYNGMDDFDGKWAIWDEPFLQFSLDKMHGFHQPFVATVFSATSHHPYNIPKQYEGQFKGGKLPIYRCEQYTDLALRRFFERARKEPWYRNTIFVLVADHTNQNEHAEYKTDLGLYSIPIIFFTPDGSLKPQCRTDVIAQQADITPTLLHLLGYQQPIVAFGCDLLSTPPGETWAFNYNNGIYQMEKGDLMLQFDGKKTVGLYRFKTDRLLRHNLAGTLPAEQAQLERQLKALIQQYMQRMIHNQLVVR